VSDDEEDEDATEETRLKAGQKLRDGIGFHSGFLDDDEQATGAQYQDEPESSRTERHERNEDHREGEHGSDSDSWDQPSRAGSR
jgi:kexin